MDGMKPWQIGLFIVAAVVLGGSLAFSFLGGSSLDKADRIYLVDVTTGQLYYAPVKSRGSVIVPARHPETKERTLFKVHEREDGRWELDRRTSESLDYAEVRTVGPDGYVNVLDDDPVKYVAPPFD